MSTRATILVTDLSGKTTQYYHHHDGYPEYMGKVLDSFCRETKNLNKLLETKKDFEVEKKGFVHTDIEYCWYVKVTEKGFKVSYTYKDFDTRDIIIRSLLNKKQGENIYSRA